MAARTQDDARQTQNTAKDPTSVDSKVQQTRRSPQDDATAEQDSPKRHGDKLEPAVRAAAGKTGKG